MPEMDEFIERFAENMQRSAADQKWVAANTRIVISTQYTCAGKRYVGDRFRTMDHGFNNKLSEGWKRRNIILLSNWLNISLSAEERSKVKLFKQIYVDLHCERGSDFFYGQKL